MTPDHDAAKKWAGSLGTENTFGACGPDMLNLARAYLDLVACEQRAVAADIIIERLERERDDAVRFRDEWQRVYFELIKAIGSSPASSKPPVSVALELRALLAKIKGETNA